MVAKVNESAASDDEHEIGMPAKDRTEDEIEEDAEATDDGNGDEDHGLSDRESAYESDIGDKEEDFHVIDKVKVTAVHIQILQQVDDGNHPLETEADKESFLLKYQREYLLGRNNEGDSLLHGLLVNVKEDDDAVFTRRKPLLNFLLELDPRIPTVKNDRQETALYVAVHKQLRHVVKYMCERSPEAVEALGIPKTNGDTCLHVAIQKELDFDFLSYLIDKIDKPMLVQKGEGGNTPLHLAVEWERCKPNQVRLVSRLVEASKASLEVKNNENIPLSPFQYHLATRRRSDPNKRDPTTSRPRLKNGNSSKESTSRYTESKYESKYDSKGRSSPELLKTKPESRRKRGTGKVSIADAKEVESYLMLQCMHIADREKAIDILYGAVQKKAIEFDLWGRNIISDADLNSMEAYLKFEVILQYVAIPRLTVTRSTTQAISNSNSNSNEIAKLSRKLPDCKGRVDYCLIFDWLRECGVKQILRVIVQDDQAAPHSDEIIELALEGFEIEEFDWQKVDLCTETVLKAAPNAKTVHLYSNGNNAVLRGWSDTGGLQRLKSLEKVHLVISQGLESVERTLENVRSFKERLLQLCPKVKVFDKVMKMVSATQDTGASEKQIAQDKQKQKWLDCMDDFATFMLNYPKEPQEKIKVALIDDGVDTAFEDLGSNFAIGVSYDKRANGLYNSYFQSSGGHGTVMASLIRRICPHVRIYVAKLDEKLTAASAAKAVRWAITMGVHVISMSWTIEKTPQNAKEIDSLEKAIAAADRKNILLFCSASDQGNNAKKDQSQIYPAKAKPDKIFQIGAATASGKGWEWLGHGHVDFIFPGEKLLLQQKLDALPDTLSGSSLATALAAGMAALILHCAELQNHADLALLKNYERMKEAFTAVGVSDGYLLVWETFEISNDDFRSESDILRGVVRKLLNKSIYGLNRTPTVEFK